MSKLRLIGGRHRGKRLVSPVDRSVRPTGERAREALFNILDHAGQTAGARFLDLFCGTGAVGLEAWSRGAAEVWLIDCDIAMARRNAEALGRPADLHIRRADLPHLGPAPCRFDVIFLDPPYQSTLAALVLPRLDQRWLADDGMVVVELAAKAALDCPPDFEILQERQYGAAKLVFLRRRFSL